VIRQESWILDHLEIFVTIALKGAYGKRCKTEDGDATWLIALPWRMYLRATIAFWLKHNCLKSTLIVRQRVCCIRLSVQGQLSLAADHRSC